MAKDITAAAATRVAIADAAVDTPHADAADNAVPDPARCVTPDGTRTYRIAAATTPRRPRTPRSNRDDDMADVENPEGLSLGAGPRTLRPPAPRTLRLPTREQQPPAVSPHTLRTLAPRPHRLPAVEQTRPSPGESAADSDALVHGGNAGLPQLHARSDSPASVASVGLPDGTDRCSSDSGVGWA